MLLRLHEILKLKQNLVKTKGNKYVNTHCAVLMSDCHILDEINSLLKKKIIKKVNELLQLKGSWLQTDSI